MIILCEFWFFLFLFFVFHIFMSVMIYHLIVIFFISYCFCGFCVSSSHILITLLDSLSFSGSNCLLFLLVLWLLFNFSLFIRLLICFSFYLCVSVSCKICSKHTRNVVKLDLNIYNKIMKDYVNEKYIARFYDGFLFKVKSNKH